MAAQQEVRSSQEQGMLNNIAGREDEAPDAAPKVKSGPGWMAYVGGVLWLGVLGVAGLAVWLAITSGG